MKAVVSGSAGFIGRHLVDGLVGRGYRVTGIDRQLRSSQTGYEHRTMDLSDDPKDSGLPAAVADADLVFHLAARPGVRGSGATIDAARQRDNVVSTANLMSVVSLDTPVVVASSSSVYGGSARRTGSRENDPLRPLGGYARSKVSMERVCEERRAGGGIVAVVRPFTVAGESQRSDMAFSVWLDALRKGQRITLFGSENRSRDITDIRDAVEGLIRAGERRVNTAVNLGTGQSHRLIEMAETLREISGLGGDIVLQPASTVEVEATLADTSLCQTLLGFVPTTDLRALLVRQVGAAVERPMSVAT